MDIHRNDGDNDISPGLRKADGHGAPMCVEGQRCLENMDLVLVLRPSLDSS